MLPLFACFALRAEHNNSKFLQYLHHKRNGGGRIEASADTVAGNARARFFSEPSEEHQGLVHVRFCYNNKYWVPLQVQEEDSGGSHWIIGAANEPEEDLSSPSCTLFRHSSVKDKDNSIRFFHSGLREYGCAVSIGDKTYLQLRDDAEDEETNSDIFTVVGLPRQKELPKYVAFKGDNGKYLGTKHVLGSGTKVSVAIFKGLAFLAAPVFVGPILLMNELTGEDQLVQDYGNLCQQSVTEDIGDASAIFTTYTNDDGTVRIASNEGGFWKRDSDDWIMTGHVEDKNDRDALFEVVTGDGFIALRNLGNNKFCKRLDDDGRSSCLSACDGSISQYARLKLEEPVISQEIYDVKFYLDEARIYNNAVITMESDARTNGTLEVQTGTFSFTKKTEVASTWETTVSSKTVVSEKFSASIPQIPIVLGAEVTLSNESASSHSDTGSTRNSEERTVTQNFTISPGETIKAKFVASRASCDVPFSYKQKDVLTTGKEIVTVHNDGMYTGVNKYDFHITLTRS